MHSAVFIHFLPCVLYYHTAASCFVCFICILFSWATVTALTLRNRPVGMTETTRRGSAYTLTTLTVLYGSECGT